MKNGNGEYCRAARAPQADCHKRDNELTVS